MHYRTASTQERRGEHVSLVRARRSLRHRFCLLVRLMLVLRAQGKYTVAITKLEC